MSSPSPGAIDVLHRDDDLLVVSKAAGLPVVAARGEPPDACLRRILERDAGPLWVVHRIDRDTSGLVLLARSAAAHRSMCLAFEERRVDKVYVAFAAGAALPDAGRIDVPLHAARRGKARPAHAGEAGQEALTEYDVRRRWQRGDATVMQIEARPRTGRHHQIRVHLRAVGAPIVGDPLYAGRPAAALAGTPCARLALHAAGLEVPALRGGGRLAWSAPLPADLRALAAWLDG